MQACVAGTCQNFDRVHLFVKGLKWRVRSALKSETIHTFLKWGFIQGKLGFLRKFSFCAIYTHCWHGSNLGPGSKPEHFNLNSILNSGNCFECLRIFIENTMKWWTFPNFKQNNFPPLFVNNSYLLFFRKITHVIYFKATF